MTPDALRQTLKHYPAEVQQAAEPLFKRLTVDVAKQEARLKELETQLKQGTPSLGSNVFNSSKAACSGCHTIGREGSTIGPNLSKIGAIRTKRDLLEAIVFPSASLVQGYEPYSVGTQSGKIYTGVLKRETADEIVLATADRTEVRVPRADIETFGRSRVSIMPQGIDGQLSTQELADLLAFLQARK